MKGLKLSKTSWLILSAGIFVVVLAGLGVTRSQQLKEQGQLTDELTVSENRLSKLQVTQLTQDLEALKTQIEESDALLTEAKNRMRQTVASVDVIDALFDIADFSGVTVFNLSCSPINSASLSGGSYSVTNINAQVKGELANIIDFIIGVNGGYSTGVIRTTQINISGDGEPTASIQMVVYSFEGS